jgi:competence protein ComEA
MKQVKFFTRIVLLSLVAILAAWQTTALAADTNTLAAEQQVSTVNINTASAEAISNALNGVSMKRADTIVAYRKANGVFTSIDQLLNVKGVGEKTLEKNRDRIVLE